MNVSMGKWILKYEQTGGQGGADLYLLIRPTGAWADPCMSGVDNHCLEMGMFLL